LGNNFERKITKCCKVFGVHKNKNVKPHKKNYFKMAEKLLQNGKVVCPGWKLCGTCFKCASSMDETTLSARIHAE